VKFLRVRAAHFPIFWEYFKCRWLPHREYLFDSDTGKFGKVQWHWRLFK
jgi:hypothetical protein